MKQQNKNRVHEVSEYHKYVVTGPSGHSTDHGKSFALKNLS